MKNAIVAEHLCKTYTRTQPGEHGLLRGALAFFRQRTVQVSAVSELSFTIGCGEAIGLIGENGAGKSTTVKMLTGVLVPSSGRVATLGMDPFERRRELALNIGVVFGQKPQLLWDLPARESFKLLKAMYRIPDAVYKYTYESAVERLELAPLLSVPVRLMSLGQRMRCDLAASLLHAPRIAFLDEPTIGLDLLVKERVREHLNDMRRRFGMTLVLTTHDLKDITETCERLLVLDKGRLLYEGPIDGFERRFGAQRTLSAELESAQAPDAQRQLEAELHPLHASVEWEGAQRIHVVCERQESVPRVTATVLAHLRVRDLVLRAPDIESLVARLYRKVPASE